MALQLLKEVLLGAMQSQSPGFDIEDLQVDDIVVEAVRIGDDTWVYPVDDGKWAVTNSDGDSGLHPNLRSVIKAVGAEVMDEALELLLDDIMENACEDAIMVGLEE